MIHKGRCLKLRFGSILLSILVRYNTHLNILLSVAGKSYNLLSNLKVIPFTCKSLLSWYEFRIDLPYRI